MLRIISRSSSEEAAIVVVVGADEPARPGQALWWNDWTHNTSEQTRPGRDLVERISIDLLEQEEGILEQGMLGGLSAGILPMTREPPPRCTTIPRLVQN
jgi:hypothetical protein